ncbi:MAG TPA: hypothetical protein VGH87_29005 [Polyangiaceae bacterium]|jgi:hypothetical protein
MSKVDTDEGLGPGSERQRQKVLDAQKQLDSRSKQKAAEPAPDSGRVQVDKNAETEPGIGKVERKNDTVDSLLDGFSDRQDRPRILPNNDTTPPPDPVRKELTPTSPGKRQRTRNMLLATLATFGVVAAVGVGLVKFGSSSVPTPATTVTVTVTAPITAPTTTETMAPITTTAIEALPTVKTSAPQTTAPTTTRTVHSATTATATATQTTAPRPTGSAPPGMNLLPDDPHR